jgi:hypothetical protein
MKTKILESMSYVYEDDLALVKDKMYKYNRD